MAGARTSTARRYAEASFQIAERDGTIEQWLHQLAEAGQLVADPRVVHMLENPETPIDGRLAIFRETLGEGMLPQLPNLLTLILLRRRVDQLPRLAREFRRLYNKKMGIVEAIATSAAELDEAELSALRSRLEQMTSAKIELTTAVDPSLLGGVQVRLGDLLIDGSVRGRLEQLRSRLASGALTP